jgi:hypothetical protein
MKTPIMAATLAIIGAGLCAGQSATAQKATMTVCMETTQETLMGVRPLASAMFARIGLRIDWHEPDSCPAGASAIHVRFSSGATRVYGASSHALAFAQPFEGTIVVFLDRVQALKRNGTPSVMAHVLVHEIAHVLEGIDRHSATGIMKARWDDRDYDEMRSKPPAFAQEDVTLIYNGLKAPRGARASAASPVQVAGQ